MTISRAIIDDLYPLYAAGEASADSRALIEEYLAENPGAAASLREPVNLPPVEPPPDLEVRALRRTSKLLEEKSLLGAAALTLSYIPATAEFLERNKPQLLYQDHPWAAMLIYLAAIGLWVRFFFLCRRVQAAGLHPRRTWTARTVWVMSGTMIGFSACAPLWYWTGWRDVVYFVPWIVFSIAFLMGEWLGQIPKVEDLTRPTALFGPHDPDGEN
jgi:hypothetical protein